MASDLAIKIWLFWMETSISVYDKGIYSYPNDPLILIYYDNYYHIFVIDFSRIMDLLYTLSINLCIVSKKYVTALSWYRAIKLGNRSDREKE